MRLSFTFFVLGCISLLGCQTNQTKIKLSRIDSLLISEQKDSAYNLIKTFDESIVITEEDHAHLDLLRVQTAYLVDEPIEFSDSILESVISFYEKHIDHEKLSEAYFYKAELLCNEHAFQEAIAFYKKAEQHAIHTGEKRLLFKIYEGITYVNRRSGKRDIELNYAKKTLEMAKAVDRKHWIAYSYYGLAFAYLEYGFKDSATVCLNRLLPLINSVDKEEKPVLLSSIGYLLLNKQPDEAKKYLLESLKYQELTATYIYLSKISYDKGFFDEAYQLWKKALTVQDATPKDNVIRNIIEYDMERGKTDSICERINEIIAIRDSIDAKLKNDTIKDLQTRFDHEVAMREKDQTVIRWQWIAIILVVLLLLVVVYYLVRKYQARILLQKSQMQINDYMEQIRELKSDKGDQTTEITRLNKEVKRIMDERSPRLSQGRMLYDKIVTSEKMSRWQKDDVRKVIEYCTAINYRMVNRLKSVPRQHQLTPHQLLYLILVEMGKSDLEILQILSISKETLRGLRHKTKPLDESGSEKTDESL